MVSSHVVTNHSWVAFNDCFLTTAYLEVGRTGCLVSGGWPLTKPYIHINLIIQINFQTEIKAKHTVKASRQLPSPHRPKQFLIFSVAMQCPMCNLWGIFSRIPQFHKDFALYMLSYQCYISLTEHVLYTWHGQARHQESTLLPVDNVLYSTRPKVYMKVELLNSIHIRERQGFKEEIRNCAQQTERGSGFDFLF